MTKYLYFLLPCFVFMACNSDDDGIKESAFDPGAEIIEEEMVIEAEKGVFVSDAHPTSGTVTVNADNSLLLLDMFKTDDGPKLLMYLTSDLEYKDYVDLGDLKGIEGNFEYDIPPNTDLEKYKYVVVWCVDFSVSFGHAELE